jgi:hypothetical protein
MSQSLCGWLGDVAEAVLGGGMLRLGVFLCVFVCVRSED